MSHYFLVDGALGASPSSPTASSTSRVLSSTNLCRPFGTMLVAAVILAI